MPQVTNEADATNWIIRVHGLVEREVTLTLKELQKQFTVVTLPVTLVCAGNRRKEQNIVSKTLGFNWGAAAGRVASWWLNRPVLTNTKSSVDSTLDWRLPGRYIGLRETKRNS